MIFEQIATGGCQSYLVGCPDSCTAALIDPEIRQIDRYLASAARDGLRIRYLIDTHTHADHFSATRELGSRLGVPIVMHTLSPAPHASLRVNDGDMLVVGNLRLQMIHTPGHTRDSMCVHVADRLFTGDTLLIGATGRTDLPTGDADALYDSLFNGILKLDPALRVFPAHDYKNQGSTTLGREIADNPRLQKRDRAAFVDMMNHLNIAAPTHLTEALRTNLTGGKTVAQLLAEAAAKVPFMSLAELKKRIEQSDNSLIVLDVREKDAFDTAHVPGALHLPRGQLELRINEVLPDPTTRIVTVCEFGKISTLAAATLRELGFLRAAALDGGMKAWRDGGCVFPRDMSISPADWGKSRNRLTCILFRRTLLDIQPALSTEVPMACAAPPDPEANLRKWREFEVLEAKITELWGHLNAATYRFLTLVAEFDREQAYERHGLVNTAQWLNWQCGIGPVASREKVRVARALEQLPEISAAFEKGEISYSKVRAMTRVATPANESVLVHIARYGTAGHVEKLVRKYRWTQRRDAGLLEQQLHAQRHVNYFSDLNGEFILNARLPPEIGAVVRKAIETAVEALREPSEPPDSHGHVSAETDTHESPTAGARRADALGQIAETFLAQRGEDTGAGSSAARYQVVVHIDQAILSDAPTAMEDEAHRCELDDGPAVALDTARRLACDATIVGIVDGEDGEPLDIGRKSRSIPPALARALRARDGGCRFPGCDRTRFTDGHHVKHWADGGETKLSNLITLCGFHHRLVHEGGFGVKATDDGVFVFTRPDGRRVEENGAQCFRGNNSRPKPTASPGFEETLRLYMLNREAGVAIAPGTSRCQWLGERMDYSMAIEGMQFLEERAGAAPTG